MAQKNEGRAIPAPEDLRVMRMPGECLRQDVQRLEERTLYAVVLSIFPPLVLGWLSLQLFVLFPSLWLPGIALSAVALSLAGLATGIWWLVRLTEKIRDKSEACWENGWWQIDWRS